VIPTQSSAVLPLLFDQFDESERLTVLHIGPALPETVEFFSRYRCKLHFFDLFAELADLLPDADETRSPRQRLADMMHIPAGARFDLCLFWDLFNFLDRDVVAALMHTLRPHLHTGSLAHGFAVHNLRTAQSRLTYGVVDVDQISLRPRTTDLPGYSPYNRGQLEKLLDCFLVSRSVLLPDSRLELLLEARL